jgi:peptidoglycan/LPS O-acetylase OafA/YrhL
MKYRPDIDGIRALAILPVIFYHAGVPLLSGGFVGVDIFFVISGFLIGGIIIDAKNTGGFSYVQFYERRAKRLLPALFTMIGITAVAGYFLLMPENYKELYDSTIYTILFASNFYFLENINYFGQEAEFMPLLHTWSLAVEEQFYIIWPLILSVYVIIVQKYSKRLALLFIIVLVVLSLSASIILLGQFASFVFYMTPLRLWELGIGTIVAIAIRNHSSIYKLPTKSMYLLGIGLCLASIFMLDQESAFPGMSAVPVVIGTALLLMFGDSDRNYISNIFRWSPMVLVGKLSYSLYLSHWIVLTFFRTYKNEVHLSGTEIFYCLAISFVIAFFSWYCIENPLRFRTSRKQIAYFSFSIAALLIIVSAVGIMTSGAEFRLKSNVDYISSREKTWQWQCETQTIEGLGKNICVFGTEWESADRRIVLWGDSHADHFAPLVEFVAKQNNAAVLLWRRSTPFIDDKKVRYWHKRGTKMSEGWGRLQRKMIDWLLKYQIKLDGIILASAWSGYPKSLFDINPDDRSIEKGLRLIRTGMKALLDQLPSNIPVTILTDIPRPRKNLVYCAYEAARPVMRSMDSLTCQPLERTEINKWHAPTTALLKNLTLEHDNLDVIDMVDKLCNSDNCPIFLEGRLLYRDDNHIRRNLNDNEKRKLVDLMKLNDAKVFSDS